MKIFLHMLKKWGHSLPGQTVAFDESKGRRVIAGGFAVEVPDPKSKAEVEAKAKSEADAKAKTEAEAKAKAEAEAKAKAKTEAEAKAKAEVETAMVTPGAEMTDARPNIKEKPQKPKKKK